MRIPFLPTATALSVALLLALAACSRQSDQYAPESTAEMAAAEEVAADAAPAAPPPPPAPQRAMAPGGAISGAAPSAPGEPAPPPDAQTQLQSAATTQPDDGERRFIRTASAQFRVREVYRSALAIEDLVAQHGGFVARNDIRTDIQDVRTRPSGDGNLIELATYTVRGDLQVRVPSARAQSFLRAVAGQVEFLDSRSFAAVDAQFELLRQQLAYAREHQAQQQLGQIAQTDGRLRERTDAVGARSQAQMQRDEALIQQKTFEDRVAFATLDLSLYQLPQVRRTERVDVDAILLRDGPSFFSRLWHSVSAGWYGLLNAVVALASLWPLWLVLAGVVVVARRWRARRPAA